MSKLERFLMGDFDLAGLPPATSTTELPTLDDPPVTENASASPAFSENEPAGSASKPEEECTDSARTTADFSEAPGDDVTAEPIENWIPLDLCEDVDSDQFLAMIQRLSSQGYHLRALSAVRIFAHCGNEPDAHRALALLLETTGPESTDPLPTDFLGTSRVRMAWSVLRRDTLELAPHTEARTSDKEWTVTLDPRPRPGAPEGWALVWRSSTAISRSVRPAGERKKARRRLRLPAEISIWRANSRDPIRAQVEVIDISTTGAGIRLNDRYGRLTSIELKGSRIRMQISIPETGSVATLAIIRRFESSPSGDSTMGVEFSDPPSEFTAAVTNLLTLQRGDLQYLWSAWDALARKS